MQSALKDGSVTPTYRPLTKYPSVIRDVSFLVKRDMTFASISDAIKSQGTPLCQSVVFVDIYEGKGMAEDERSITVRLEYRNDERTLVEDEVDAEHQQILSNLAEKLGVSLRFQ